jgi:autotransporter-associated beta strand protein
MHRRPWHLARHHEAHWKEKLVPRFQSVSLGSRSRCAHGAAVSAGKIVRAAMVLLAAASASAGQLPVTNYSFTVAPTSNYANQNLTVLTNGIAQVNVWPSTADTAQLVGWFDTNPGIQFNFTGGQSVSDVTIWAANSKGSAGVWLPVTVTITSGTSSKTLTVTPPSGSGTTTPLTITGISGAADSFTITAIRDTSGSPNGWTMFSEAQFFGTGAKAANTSALNLATSWTGTQAPVSTDVVLFNTTYTSTTALDTGAAVNWAGVKVTGGSGTLTIDPSSTANRLGIGSSGIDLSGATRDVRLTDLRLTGSTPQAWSIAAGRSLSVGADSLAQDTGANPAVSGSGTLVKEGSSTGLAIGSLTSFTGTLSVQAGSVTTSAANQLTGNYGVSLATGGTLRLGGNETLPTNMNSGLGTIEILASSTVTITNASARTVDRFFTGAGGLSKTGIGTLTLSGSNDYSGGTLVAGGAGSNGFLKAGSNWAFGSGTITITGSNAGSGNTLDVNGATLTNAIVVSYINSGANDGSGALQNTNTSTAAVLNGSVVFGGQNYVGGDGSIVFNGIVSGGTNNVYSLYKQGAGTWTFANPANTFDGFYYQIGGVTEVTKLANLGETSSLGAPSTTTQNFVSFGFNGSGGGTIRYIGSTASTSDRAFSLRGDTAAASNTIEAAGASSADTLTLTGGLSAGRAAAYTARLTGTNAGVNDYAGAIANGSSGGTVALVKDGSTTWALTGANTYSGATTVSSGTLKVGNAGTTGSLGSGGASVAAGATLAFDRSDSGFVVANAISGSGNVIQIGSGTTSLTGANTYSGTTHIAAGTLRIGNNAAAGSLGSGSVVNDSALAFNRSDSYSVSNTINGTGVVVKQAAGTLTLTGTSTYSGGTRLEAGTLVVGSDAALGTGTLSFATAGATLQTARNVLVPIDVATSGSLAIVGSGVDLTARFSGSGTLTKTGTGTLTLSGTGSTFSGSLVIAGGAGANSIVKAGNTAAFGTGTVTIQGSGGNTGSTFDLNGYSLDNGLVVGLGNSGVGNAGALQNSNAASPAVLNGAVSLGGEIYVGGAGDIRFNGLISGTVNPANDYSLYKDGAGTWTYANTGNTFDGYYYQVGGVTEVTKLANLNEPSSLGQPTTSGRNRVSFGFNGAGGGTLRFIGGAASTSDRVFVLAGGTAASSTVIEASGTSPAATLTLTGGLSANRAGTYAATLGGTNAGVNVYAGTIGNGSATSVAIVKDGPTTWALTGANSYTGVTTIADGTLKVGNAGTTGSLGSGGVTNNARLVFDRTNSLTVATIISGTGEVEQAGSGITLLTAANTYSGPTLVSSGTLSIGDGGGTGTLGTGTASIATGATLAVNRSDNLSLATTFGGPGRVLKQGSNMLTLTGSSDHSGGTVLAGGTLAVGSDMALGTGTLSFATNGVTLSSTRSLTAPIDVATTATLAAGANPITLSGRLTGSGTLTKTGTGTLTLSGSGSTFSGSLVIAGGAGANSIVKAGNTAAFGTGTVTILGSGGNTGSTFDLNGQSLDNGLVIGLGNSGVGDTGALQNSNAASPAVLNGPVSLGGEIYVGGAGDIRFNGLISGTVNPANDYSLYKDGAGTWTYANTGNTFDGYYYQFGGVTEVTKLADLNEPSSLGQPTTSDRNRVSFGFNGSGGGTLRYIGGAASTSDRVFVLAGGTAASSTVIEASGTSPAATLTLTGGLSANRAGTYAATFGGTNAGVNVYAGTIGNGSATSVAIVKDGPTTWALTGTSTYTGPTTVAAGRLSVNGILGTTPVAVLAAAELGGSGAIGGPVSVAAGGSLAPGNSIASLATGTANFAAGATFAYEVDSTDPLSLGTAADLLVVSGGLNLDAGNGTLLSFTDLNSSPQPFVDTATIFALINYSGAWNGGLFNYGGTPLADGGTFTVGSQQWQIDYNSPTGGSNYTSDYLPSSSFVTVMAVPEPATLVLLAAGVGFLAALARLRRSRPARQQLHSMAPPAGNPNPR